MRATGRGEKESERVREIESKEKERVVKGDRKFVSESSFVGFDSCITRRTTFASSGG